MKYVVAIISGLFIFIAVSVLMGILFTLIFPKNFNEIVINLGALTVNLPTLIAVILGGLAATATFKASLHAKTGKLYSKQKKVD